MSAGRDAHESGSRASGATPRVKICGLATPEDALHAEAVGADYVGIVLTPGFGRSVSLRAAPSVVEELSVPRVAVLVDPSPTEVEAASAAVGATVVQLHGGEEPELVRELRRTGAWTLWKAVRARSVADIRRCIDDFGDWVDGILVEGWREGVVGGAGVRVTLDPGEVRAAVPASIDFILAGGLDPDTVSDAVARFAPDVVDVSSGVERERGRKDPDLVEAFVRAARRTAANR